MVFLHEYFESIDGGQRGSKWMDFLTFEDDGEKFLKKTDWVSRSCGLACNLLWWQWERLCSELNWKSDGCTWCFLLPFKESRKLSSDDLAPVLNVCLVWKDDDWKLVIVAGPEMADAQRNVVLLNSSLVAERAEIDAAQQARDEMGVEYDFGLLQMEMDLPGILFWVCQFVCLRNVGYQRKTWYVRVWDIRAAHRISCCWDAQDAKCWQQSRKFIGCRIEKST